MTSWVCILIAIKITNFKLNNSFIHCRSFFVLVKLASKTQIIGTAFSTRILNSQSKLATDNSWGTKVEKC